MLKPPAPTMPGMTDTLDFVKNLWGAMNIPGTGMPGASGIAAPTLSTDELDKRIADLKAVESWLNMNIGMLRGTIQAMEVQRGTLAAIKSMGSSMAEAMRQSGVGTDKMASLPFMPFFNPAPGKPGSAEDAAAAQAVKPPSGGATPPSGAASAQPGATAPASAEDASAALGMPAALAWWNLLQDQFQQAVSSAMTSTASAVPGAPGTPAAPAASAGASNSSNGKAAASAPQSGSASGAGGNGKARATKSRTDKA
jgi:hypothetical protein